MNKHKLKRYRRYYLQFLYFILLFYNKYFLIFNIYNYLLKNLLYFANYNHIWKYITFAIRAAITFHFIILITLFYYILYHHLHCPLQ